MGTTLTIYKEENYVNENGRNVWTKTEVVRVYSSDTIGTLQELSQDYNTWGISGECGQVFELKGKYLKENNVFSLIQKDDKEVKLEDFEDEEWYYCSLSF